MKRGHVTGNKREQHGTPMYAEPYEVRLKRWEDKQMQQQAAAATTQAAAK